MQSNSRRSSTLRLPLSQVADARLWYGIVILSPPLPAPRETKISARQQNVFGRSETLNSLRFVAGRTDGRHVESIRRPRGWRAPRAWNYRTCKLIQPSTLALAVQYYGKRPMLDRRLAMRRVRAHTFVETVRINTSRSQIVSLLFVSDRFGGLQFFPPFRRLLRLSRLVV
jgi:hypothetical protein